MGELNISSISIKVSSNGGWQGDNPLHFAFPLLILQITLVLLITRLLAFLLKPLRQPKVIAEIFGGVLLGPSAFGRNKDYLNQIFPTWSMPLLETVSSIGLLFFLFLVGLELDLSSIRRTGKTAFGIAFSGLSLPFISGIGIAFVLRKTIEGADKVGYGSFFVFMGVSLSITAFPVLARILAELKLLTTQVGEIAMAAAAFNDVVAWVLLALAVAIAGNETKNPLTSVFVLLSGVAFVAFMLLLTRPAMKWITRRRSGPGRGAIDEACICLTLVGVMVSGFITDLIGIHSVFGAFIFGLTIPKEGEFAERLIERIEDFVSGLLLPLYFASSGLKTNVATINGGKAWCVLMLVIATACAGKIVGTSGLALLIKMPVREALTLGVLMNTKGLVELIVLNIGKEKKVLNDEIFAILVLMALVTSFITTPTVMAIYKPGHDSSAVARWDVRDLTSTHDYKDELRVLACLHGTRNVPSIITLIESIRSTKKSRLKLFTMYLVELTERSSSIIMVHRLRRNGVPFVNRLYRRVWQDRVAAAFHSYSQLGRVSVRPTTAISALSTIHEDICHLAYVKRVTMIVLPFHKQWRAEGEEPTMENLGHAWRLVNQRVVEEAPCSVALLVDCGLGDGAKASELACTLAPRVCILFLGGPDNVEALALGGRMAEHPAVKLTIVRLLGQEGLETDDAIAASELDNDAAVEEFRSKWEGTVEYTERTTGNLVEQVLGLGQCGDYDLIIVGKGRFPSSVVAELGERKPQHEELGPIGDLLVSSGRCVTSVLVIQQHNKPLAEETAVAQVVEGVGDFSKVV